MLFKIIDRYKIATKLVVHWPANQKSINILDPQNQKSTKANPSISQYSGCIVKLPIPLQLQDTGEGVVPGWWTMASVRWLLTYCKSPRHYILMTDCSSWNMVIGLQWMACVHWFSPVQCSLSGLSWHIDSTAITCASWPARQIQVASMLCNFGLWLAFQVTA